MFGRVIDRFSHSAIIMYHRVADVAHDPWGLAVSPDNFARQLSLLKRDHEVLAADEFIELMSKRKLPRRAIMLTFDDGYRDNLTQAAPLLAAEGLPATLFLATGPASSQEPYWFEDLSAMILDAEAPADLSLDIDGTAVAVRFDEREPLDDDRAGWRAWDTPRTARERVFYTLWDRIRVLDQNAQRQILAELRGYFPVRSDTDTMPMSYDDIRELAAGPFAIGGHTVDHADLLALDDDAALAQIGRGKAEVEALVGKPISGFAYPYGRHNARVAELVRAAGFGWACTTEHARVRRGDGLYFLPRLAAEDTPDIDWVN